MVARFLLLWLLLWLAGWRGNLALGQEAPPADTLATAVDSAQGGGVRVPTGNRKAMADSLLGFRIAPLDTLIARALQQSPEMAGQEALIKSRSATLRYQNRQWLKMFQPIAGVSYGTGTIIASVDDGSGANVNLANQQNLLYNVGFTLRFTAEDIFNRKPRAEVLEWEIEKLRQDQRVQARMVRERVIMGYEALLMSAELLILKAQQMQTNRINCELAERYFHSGDMSYADYNGALGDKLAAEIQFLNAKSEFQTQYLLLMELVGGPLE